MRRRTDWASSQERCKVSRIRSRSAATWAKTWLQVSSLVAHEHMDRLGVARREVFEIAAIPLQAHAGQEREVGFSIHRAVF